MPPAEIDRRIKQMGAQGHDRFESRHKFKGGKLIDLEVSIVVMPQDTGDEI